MIGYWELRWRLWRIERWRRRGQRKLRKTLEEARKRKATGQEIYEIEETAFWDERELDEDVYFLHTRYLMAEAARLVLPMAKYHTKESWEEGRSARYLKEDVLNELRTLVRAENKVRRENWLMWVPLFTALTGLGGVVIGVLTLLWKTTPK